MNLVAAVIPKVQTVDPKPPSNAEKEKLEQEEALRQAAREERRAEKERQRQLDKEKERQLQLLEMEREAEVERERKAKAKAERERQRQLEKAKSLRDVTNSPPPSRFTSPAPEQGSVPPPGIEDMMEDGGESQTAMDLLDADGARERRTRKSVNYAEPKLNTCVFHSLL